MDKKGEMFDLKREKQDLEDFLSQIVESQPPVAAPVKPAVVHEKVPAEKPSDDFEIQGLKLPPQDEIKPPVKPEIRIQAVEKPRAEKAPSDHEISFSPEFNEFFPKPSSDQNLPKMPVPSFSGKDRQPKVPQIHKEASSFGNEKPDNSLKPDDQAPTQKDSIPVDPSSKKEQPMSYAPEAPGGGKRTVKLVLLLIVLLIVAAASYLWMYPDRAQKSLDWIRTSAPFADKLIGGPSASVQAGIKEVTLRDVRQRLVYNSSIGQSIRIIEGQALNQATHDLSSIRLVAQLYDQKGAPLTSTTAFGGVVLTNEELESLSAMQIAQRLQDRSAVAKVPPKGQTAFMVVFTQEPPGVHRMSVVPDSFQK